MIIEENIQTGEVRDEEGNVITPEDIKKFQEQKNRILTRFQDELRDQFWRESGYDKTPDSWPKGFMVKKPSSIHLGTEKVIDALERTKGRMAGGYINDDILHIHRVDLDDEGIEAICNVLAKNDYFEEVHLVMCDIGVQGAVHIANMLKLNKKIKILGLGGNPLGDEGSEIILKALCDNETLEGLDLGTLDYHERNIAKDSNLLDVMLHNKTVQTIYLSGYDIDGEFKLQWDRSFQEIDQLYYNVWRDYVDLNVEGSLWIQRLQKETN